MLLSKICLISSKGFLFSFTLFSNCFWISLMIVNVSANENSWLFCVWTRRISSLLLSFKINWLFWLEFRNLLLFIDDFLRELNVLVKYVFGRFSDVLFGDGVICEFE